MKMNQAKNLQLKNIIIEMNISIEGLNNRFEQVGEKISKLEDQVTELIHIDKQKENKEDK